MRNMVTKFEQQQKNIRKYIFFVYILWNINISMLSVTLTSIFSSKNRWISVWKLPFHAKAKAKWITLKFKLATKLYFHEIPIFKAFKVIAASHCACRASLDAIRSFLFVYSAKANHIHCIPNSDDFWLFWLVCVLTFASSYSRYSISVAL